MPMPNWSRPSSRSWNAIEAVVAAFTLNRSRNCRKSAVSADTADWNSGVPSAALTATSAAFVPPVLLNRKLNS